MYRKIIIGHDLHAGGRDALALGSLLVAATGAELVVAGVFPFGTLPRGFDATWRADERATAAELHGVADAAGESVEALPSSSPARGLHDLAEEVGADLVVVGSSRHGGVGRILAGDVALGLMRCAPCAVAVAPRGFARAGVGDVVKLVVGVDGSPESRLVLDEAVELARATGAHLRLVAVARPPVASPAGLEAYAALRNAIEDAAREHLNGALGAVSHGVTTEASLISGDPAAKLADAARGASLLMLGSRSLGSGRRALLGSVSARLAREAPCPLLVHPRSATPHEPRVPVAV